MATFGRGAFCRQPARRATHVTAVHANVVVVGEAGVLIRGPSGSGKSQLSIALIDEAEARGAYAALVADDRAHLSIEHGRLVARGAPGFEGVLEQRGEGLIRLKESMTFGEEYEYVKLFSQFRMSGRKRNTVPHYLFRVVFPFGIR